MSLGTVIASRSRGKPVEAIVKYYDIDVTLLDSYDNQPQFEKAFPLKKFPVYIGPKGFKLQESFAICLYCMYL